jgi:hypothetical protein
MAGNQYGTNETTITGDNGSSTFHVFDVTGMFNTVSNFAVKGDGSNDEVDAFHNSGWYNRYSHLYVRECATAFYVHLPGLCDNSVIADNWRVGRVIFDNPSVTAFYDAYYPLAWDSTNYFVWEDCRFDWTSAKNDFAPPANALITSQQGEAYVVRNCYIRLNGGGGTAGPQPAFDFHGDDSGSGLPRAGTAMQIYSNYFDLVSGTFSGNKFCDVRGSRSLIYSNRCVGDTWSDGITYREERPSDSPNYLVNNSYEWENYDGAAGTTAMGVFDDANITAGVDYFTSAISPLNRIPYPHPLRNEAAAGGGGGGPPTLNTIARPPNLRLFRLPR